VEVHGLFNASRLKRDMLHERHILVPNE
jgi:hypothetical protein